MAIYRVEYKSKTLKKSVRFSAIIPNDVSISTKKKYAHSYERATKTLFLLHGYNGDETTFLKSTPVKEYSEKYNLAIILPSCRNSYYLNLNDSKDGYQTFITKELVEYVRLAFNLSKDRDDTIIGGVSMGGYGALHSALFSCNTFSKVIAISPALIIEDLRSPNPDFSHGNYHFLLKTFGDFKKLSSSDSNYKVLFDKNIDKGYQNPDIFIAVGIDDFLLEGCRDFRDFLKERTSRFSYIEDEGVHSHSFLLDYLETAIKWSVKN